jgi:L-histidine Nalpha-methyltransferase
MLASAIPIEQAATDREFLSDVVAGLSQAQKTLPPKYLYDRAGSALFEAITAIQEYGLTRADARILERCAGEVAALVREPVRVVELGSGSGRKTRWILEALGRPVYDPIDVSETALDQCKSELSMYAERIEPVLASYFEGMGQINTIRGHERLLVLYLGSTIGNFDRRSARAFLRQLRRCLRGGDAVLIGFDLLKSREQLLAAYDDGAGITAAFNRNLLGRINRELGADFHLRAFAHEARYDDGEHRIEMHLRSRVDQTVHIASAGRQFHFREGETIWTESSHKFDPAELARMADDAGFREEARWSDDEWPFAESFWRAV